MAASLDLNQTESIKRIFDDTFGKCTERVNTLGTNTKSHLGRCYHGKAADCYIKSFDGYCKEMDDHLNLVSNKFHDLFDKDVDDFRTTDNLNEASVNAPTAVE